MKGFSGRLSISQLRLIVHSHVSIRHHFLLYLFVSFFCSLFLAASSSGWRPPTPKEGNGDLVVRYNDLQCSFGSEDNECNACVAGVGYSLWNDKRRQESFQTGRDAAGSALKATSCRSTSLGASPSSNRKNRRYYESTASKTLPRSASSTTRGA
ncbi:uncharacterized protein LOC9649733 isoform X2 [Selaginella moellendorffii]|uniref:uncharacterized protein LOC9649733 isoform X2 n=1 Tax=Selaginella moellendorffii TaxID=88036 RepID=UPI000D1C5C88|nr:uncharacterized protein LOC9649733 isoform X2 [Selaginella moellendorffii]|eukprot:XP_024537445.1 uncharacterized protein LOC9649733 isoform X2 [Selaginella moellendorffii]